jgi:hypothetical protein
MCYIAMLPRLEAERSLTHVAELQAGDSHSDAEVRRQHIRRWQRLAEPAEQRTKPTKAEFLASMADLGFAIVE